MANTISVDYIKHIMCIIKGDASMDQRYCITKPESTLCTVQLRELNNIALEKNDLSSN